MSKSYKVGDIYRPQQAVSPISNIRRNWGIITAVEESEDGVLIEFDCGFTQGNNANIFTEILTKESNVQMTPSNPIQFLDFKPNNRSTLAANPNDCAIYRRTSSNNVYQLRFPKNCETAIESGFNCVRVAVNNLTNEVFFVFSKEDGLPISRTKTTPYRISNRELVMWLEDRYNLPKDGGGILTFSENLDRAGGFTFRVMPKTN